MGNFDSTVFLALAVTASGFVIILLQLLRLSSLKKKEHSLSDKIDKLLSESLKMEQDLSKFECIMGKVDFPIWKRKEDLSIKYCNPAYTKILEDNKGENEAFENMELYRSAKDLAKKAVDENAEQIEKKHIVISGERRLYRVSESPLPNGETVGYGIDITELEDTERELKNNMSAQSDLLESSASAVAIYSPDTRIKFYNNAFLNLWKLDERFLSTNPTYGEILEVLREKRKLPEQANFKAFKKENLALFTSLIEKYEEFYYLPDNRVLRVIIIPHETGGLLFSYEDMTEQIALERSYNTLMSVKKSTLDNLFEGVAVFGQDGRLQLYNPAYAKMWKLEGAILNSEPHISDIFDETKGLYDCDNWDEMKQYMISKATSRDSCSEKIERTDNMVLQASCLPLPDGAHLMTYVDITDSARVEESLRAEKLAIEKANKIKTDFLANVSYELRSPLTSIKGFTELLQKRMFGELNDKQEEYVDAIYESSEYLTSLIDNILNVSSIDSGYMSIEADNFDLNKLLVSIEENIIENVEKKNIKFILNCEEKIGSILGDKEKLKQVLVNLLNNAVRMTDKGGTITLSAKSKGKTSVIVSVEDTGKGIAEDEQKSIFEKFYKVEGDRHSGAGLGLTVAKSFVELHGGKIKLESEVGKGAKFTITLKRNNRALAKKKNGSKNKK